MLQSIIILRSISYTPRFSKGVDSVNVCGCCSVWSWHKGRSLFPLCKLKGNSWPQALRVAKFIAILLTLQKDINIEESSQLNVEPHVTVESEFILRPDQFSARVMFLNNSPGGPRPVLQLAHRLSFQVSRFQKHWIWGNLCRVDSAYHMPTLW